MAISVRKGLYPTSCTLGPVILTFSFMLSIMLLAGLFGFFLDLDKFRLRIDPHPTSLLNITVAATKKMAKNAARARRLG